MRTETNNDLPTEMYKLYVIIYLQHLTETS